MLGNLKIGYKLLIAFLAVGLIPFATIGIISLNLASTGLSNQAFEKLTVVQEIKKAQVEEFFRDRLSHVKVISKNTAATEGIHNFKNVIRDGKIIENAYEFYGQTYGESLQQFREAFGYYDILLITKEGNVVYSGIKEADLGQNILTGDLKDSHIATFFKKAVKGVAIQGFQPYAPAGNRYISFVGAPLYHFDDAIEEHIFEGIVALKMDNTPLNTIVQRREGMGNTGETYIVSRHNNVTTLRSNLINTEEGKTSGIGNEISADYIEAAFEGEAGQGIFSSNSGDLLVSYGPLDIEDMNWAMISKIAKNEAFSTVNTLIWSILIVAVVGGIVVLIIGIMLPLTIIRPLKNVIDRIKDIAEGEGDLTLRLEVDRKDEVGELAKWFNTFVEHLQSMMKNITGNAENLDTSSSDLSNISAQMSESADHMSNKSNSVTGASDEMSDNMDSVAAAMEEASTNMDIVASSAEEMTATINEIAQNSEKARTITGDAVSQANNTSDRVGELGKAASEIDKVTEAITEISEQTNLLALNATIEAARAGEAGKGFAVVANEIKELARQTANATQEIKEKIDGIQKSTTGTITEIDQILTIINDVDEIVATIATAVEEQSVTTKEIATNVAQASQGISEVNEKVANSNKVATNINMEISEVNQASSEISNSSSQINMSAKELSDLATELKEMVNRFRV